MVDSVLTVGTKRSLLWFVLCFVAAFFSNAYAQTQRLSALAHLRDGGVEIRELWREVELSIHMTQAVPYRIFTLDNPRRVVLDFSELNWNGFDGDVISEQSEHVAEVRAGLLRPGWTRLVLSLEVPMRIVKAEMSTTTGDGARLSIRFAPTNADTFAETAGAPLEELNSKLGTDFSKGDSRRGEFDNLVVVLDPGHGGIDPGAVRENVVEADLMLSFAYELKEELLRAGGFDVEMTRTRNEFVALEDRVTIARKAGADLFISLHADALAHGHASGATVYTLADEASDTASQKLAERHDREDLLAGVDLNQQDDNVALVLMDLARAETTPRSLSLARNLVEGIHRETGATYKTPHLSADFSVLKAADIPSVLIELGFMSSPRDLRNLVDPAWRARAARGIVFAIEGWVVEDAVRFERLRK